MKKFSYDDYAVVALLLFADFGGVEYDSVDQSTRVSYCPVLTSSLSSYL